MREDKRSVFNQNLLDIFTNECCQWSISCYGVGNDPGIGDYEIRDTGTSCVKVYCQNPTLEIEERNEHQR